MASSYSIIDQAADLGIHRVHSLVLGDARKEARTAARFSPFQHKRPALGRGDVRHEEQQHEWETKRELERIARRHNLRLDETGYDDETSLANKIAAWGRLKVENAITRPDGLGTGNSHREGPNYHPIPSFGQPRLHLPLHSIGGGAPGSSTTAGRRQQLPAPAGSVAAAWQAAVLGKQFHAFALAGNSSNFPGRIRARSPIRTPARKSVVGGSRTRSSSPSVKDVGSTYADQMARVKSKISSEHAPPHPEGLVIPKTSPHKPTIPLSQSLEGNRWMIKSPPSRSAAQPTESRWSGKLATASDPYFQNPPGTSKSTPQTSRPVASQTTPFNAPPPPDASTIQTDCVESTQPTDTAPNTPASITTSIALEIEDHFDLLEAEEEEDRSKTDPDRLKRDLEINERVNQSLAEAEEAVLARDILSLRSAVTEQKTVQFATERPKSQSSTAGEEVTESESEKARVMKKVVLVWNTFRDFATVRSITGFEEFIPQPRCLRSASERLANEAALAVKTKDAQERMEATEGEEKIVEEKKEGNTGSERPKADLQRTQTEQPVTAEHASLPASEPSVPVETFVSPVPAVPTLAQATKLSAETSTPTSEAAPKVSGALKQTWNSISTLLPSAEPPLVSSTSAPAHEEKQRISASPNLAVKKTPSQVAQIRAGTSMKPEPPRHRNKLPPVSVLKDVEPADVVNTWDMPTTPLVEVDMERNIEDRQRDAGNDLFLLGLTASKKVEEKSERKEVAVIEEPKRVGVLPDTGAVPPKTDRIFIPVESPELNTTAPTTATGVKLPISSPPTTSGAHMFAAVGQPALATPMKPSTQSPHPFVASAQRSGMPISIPSPPTPRPAINPPVKSPVEPAIVPKATDPLNTLQAISTSLPFPDKVDPFFAALQPNTRKREFPARPKTPSAGTDSAESTPKISDSPTVVSEKRPSISTSSSTPLLESTMPSPTSLSPSWMLVGKTKKGIEMKGTSLRMTTSSMPAFAPSNSGLFGTDTKIPVSSATATPGITPILDPPNPTTGQALSDPSLAKSTTTTQSKKLFTFELKLGQSIISTPVHELDDPRFVAEQFARKYDLEARLPGGKGTVERLVEYFETQFAERKREREKKRAERRERLKAGSSEKQQKT